ncbi:hypothetical protein [Novosphingobium lindaniclasticum]
MTMPETTQSDLVERLRDYAPSDGMFIRCHNRSTRQMNADIRKAADELERLRKIESQMDGGRFDEWPTETFARQLRMQSRDSLDPDYIQFMAATANRMESLRAHCEAMAKGGDNWDGLARSIMMAFDMGGKAPSDLFRHLERVGQPIPQWMRDEAEMKHLNRTISKGTRCVLIYRAMAEDAVSAYRKETTHD